MDFQRLLLTAALVFTLLLMWQAWQEDYGPQPVPVEETRPLDAPLAPDAPAAPDAFPTPEGAPEAPLAAPVRPGLPTDQRVTVRTDLFEAEIDTYGAELRTIRLLDYPVTAGSELPFELLRDRGAELFVAQSGLLPGGATPNAPAPTHHALFTAEQRDYVLRPGDDALQVRLTWEEAGIEVAKVYTFRRGDYVVEQNFEVRNSGAEPWSGHAYRQLLRTPRTDQSWFLYTYTGGVISTPDDRYNKISFGDMESRALSQDSVGGWVAMIQHYFVGAWIPPGESNNNFYTRAPGQDRYIIGMIGDALRAAPGETVTDSAQLYVGPKRQDILPDVAPYLELTVDYGWTTIMARPLFWLLDKIYSLVGNWGWAIVILTLLIKLAFYKLSATSYRSMANMRKLTPRLKALKERYGDDRQKLNEAMMKIYKEEKINPLGGCLPILVQIPVFISLYWVLLESVELRHADFILWLTDLSSPDPYFILPLLMGATMLLQHRLNPTPLDPIQAKVMMVLPVVFTVFFAFFPAGLVLYWVANNTLSIAQQWYITRTMEKG